MEVELKKEDPREGFVHSECEEQCLNNSSRRQKQAGFDSGFDSMLNMPPRTPEQKVLRESLRRAIAKADEEALKDIR